MPSAIDPATRPHAIDRLGSDLLEFLEERDERLYAIVSTATRCRAILKDQVKLFRIGHDPEVARAMLNRWQGTIQEIRRLAAEL